MNFAHAIARIIIARPVGRFLGEDHPGAARVDANAKIKHSREIDDSAMFAPVNGRNREKRVAATTPAEQEEKWPPRFDGCPYFRRF